jgi:hypothetical protein
MLEIVRDHFTFLSQQAAACGHLRKSRLQNHSALSMDWMMGPALGDPPPAIGTNRNPKE